MDVQLSQGGMDSSVMPQVAAPSSLYQLQMVFAQYYCDRLVGFNPRLYFTSHSTILSLEANYTDAKRGYFVLLCQ
jgi:hypothetical protein